MFLKALLSCTQSTYINISNYQVVLYSIKPNLIAFKKTKSVLYGIARGQVRQMIKRMTQPVVTADNPFSNLLSHPIPFVCVHLYMCICGLSTCIPAGTYTSTHGLGGQRRNLSTLRSNYSFKEVLSLNLELVWWPASQPHSLHVSDPYSAV